MDLSYLQEIATPPDPSSSSRRKRKAVDEDKENSAEIIPAKRVCYSPPTHRQNWSLPEAIIYYIAKNPTSPELYQKLIRSCKYFFFKNSVIVCSDLTFISRDGDNDQGPDTWKIKQDDIEKVIDLSDPSTTKLWITNMISVFADDGIKHNLISSIIPNIYRCDIKILKLSHQTISFDEYLFLASNAGQIWLKRCTVKDENGSIVASEKLLEAAVKVYNFALCLVENDPNISSNTFKNLMAIPHFLTLDAFCMIHIPGTFDIETFFKHMKSNNHTLFLLDFSSSISDQYKARLEAILDEIIGTNDHDYVPPRIRFHGVSPEKYAKLRRISMSHIGLE